MSARFAVRSVKLPSRTSMCLGMAWGLAAFLMASPAIADDANNNAAVHAAEEAAMKAAVDAVADSVVRIEAFGGLDKVGNVLIGSGATTGVVVSEDGLVLSSAFNFVSQPSSILVTLPSGRRAGAKIIARDNARMLVLLKLNTKEELKVPELLARDQLKVGQWALAVGRTFEDGPNMSAGIVSATDRIWGKAIQSDAKVSPANYGGPLIDLEGRVMGILVPLSPQAQGEVAGIEWYDSGIGFAVPLTEVMPHLDKLKAGEDLQPGLLGISLKGGNMFADPAVIGAARSNAPAGKAGLKAGDKIIEVDGKTIERQAQLKHVLGRKYAGDIVDVVALRGEERIEAKIELVGTLDPYAHPFLGILPMRDDSDEKGVTVRYVYADSPAAKAGIQKGDRLTKLGDDAITGPAALQEMLSALEDLDDKRKSGVPIVAIREGKEVKLECMLVELPEEVPDQLPPATTGKMEPVEARPAVGSFDVKLPEEANACTAYAPEDYHPGRSHGLLVWLHRPGDYDAKAITTAWKPVCDARGLILLMPQSSDDKRWQRTDLEMIEKFVDDLRGNYNIDPTRIVSAGSGAGGAMALLAAATQREVFRGVAAADAVFPQGTRPPENDPLYRLAFLLFKPGSGMSSARMQATAKQLRALKYPVTLSDLDKANGAVGLSPQQCETIGRWIDTLDRS